MSDTPRTDALIGSLKDEDGAIPLERAGEIEELCRSLERELNAAMAQRQ